MPDKELGTMEEGYKDVDVACCPEPTPDDPWVHRSAMMRCGSCMWFVVKQGFTSGIGRCRRHAPTMNGYPVVFTSDWCGDHKLDENK
jgi:hypothetical protein